MRIATSVRSEFERPCLNKLGRRAFKYNYWHQPKVYMHLHPHTHISPHSCKQACTHMSPTLLSNLQKN